MTRLLNYKPLFPLLIILGGFLTFGSAPGSTMYVQGPTTYYVNGRTGNDTLDGRSPMTAWRTIDRANTALDAGDTVLIYGGSYRESIAPERSGTETMRITYRAVAGETVSIEGTRWLVYLHHKSYITVTGMRFQKPIRSWGEIRNGHYNEIIGNAFIGNGRKSETIFSGFALFDSSSHNRIFNNLILNWGDGKGDWGDAVRLTDNADRNLIVGNTFINAGHSLLGIDTSFNVVRGNYFENDWEKSIDLVWRVSPPYAPREEFVARRNVIENNVFAGHHLQGDGNGLGPGIQLAGAETIVRRNLFVGHENYGVFLNGWKEAPNVYGNRIYHNTVVSNQAFGMVATNFDISEVEIGGNVIKNNIFYRNNWPADGSQVKVDFGTRGGNATQFIRSTVIAGNCISGAASMQITTLNGAQSVQYYQDQYPDIFFANIDLDPEFTDPVTGDFRLSMSSPCLDAGLPLTTTVAAGSGSRVPVVDASYFTDGHGVVPGDMVKIGDHAPLRVLIVDYTNHVLTLAEPVEWNAGDPIYIGAFNGRRPDVGAWELEEATGNGQRRPSPFQTWLACVKRE